MFEKLGLSYYESKALNEILKREITLKDLSKQAGIPPGKVYSVSKSLLTRGIIEETRSRPKKLFISNASAVISKLISDKKSSEDLLYDQLMQFVSGIASSKSESNILFDIGITQDDNKRIQSRVFNESQKEVCQMFTNTHRPKSNRGNKSLWEREINHAIKRGVKFRAVYPEKSDIPKTLMSVPRNQFSIRRSDNCFARIDIVDGKKVMVKLTTHDPNMFGGIFFIDDRKLAKNLQKIFDSLWEDIC